MDPIPGLNTIQDVGGQAKPPTAPAVVPKKGGPKLAEIESLEKLLVPASAAAGAILKPESAIGKAGLSALTGFKVGEANAAFNKATPGVALFLAPEPIGVVPERFFMSKPKLPGTNIFIDPVANYTRYRDRKDRERREDVGDVQQKLLREAIPQMTDAQVSALLNDGDLRQRALRFIPPRRVDELLLGALEQRRALAATADLQEQSFARQSDTAADTELVAEAVATFFSGDPTLLAQLPGFLPSRAIQPVAVSEDQETEHVTALDRFFAANPPDP